jgi:hypothetical protein
MPYGEISVSFSPVTEKSVPFCGVHAYNIPAGTADPSLERKQNMSADIFISYKSEEEPYARRIRDVLEANGISCWMAPDSIPLGSNYMKQIPQAIEACKAVIVLVSEKSQKSIWVKNEFSQQCHSISSNQEGDQNRSSFFDSDDERHFIGTK